MHRRTWDRPGGKGERCPGRKSAHGSFLGGPEIDGEVPLGPGMKVKHGNPRIVFSAIDFSTPEVAFEHYEQERQKGERGKETMIR